MHFFLNSADNPCLGWHKAYDLLHSKRCGSIQMNGLTYPVSSRLLGPGLCVYPTLGFPTLDPLLICSFRYIFHICTLFVGVVLILDPLSIPLNLHSSQIRFFLHPLHSSI